ncbi:MAG: S-layer homology domain-containing protein, partial [Clostridia bacterium]|nr:S-layer homology domain-containing protein [Clostridia bacterium]
GGTYQNVTTSAGKLAGYYSPAFYEPLDAVKGDVARTLMYVYTRWDQRNLTDVIDSIDLLLKWCEEDPVDEYEMKRNDICQEICGSRNIYVDYPEYCWRVFGKAIPTHMKTPSGMGNICNNPQYEGVETKAATCTGNGTMTYTCKNCGYAYTEVIPSHGHHYVNGTCEYCGTKQAEIQYFRVDTLTAGDEIVIFNPSNKKVISTTATTYTKDGVVYDRLQGASATVAGTELTTTAKNVAIFKVEKSGSNYAFKLEDGRYLTCETSEFLTLTASPKSGTNKWTLEDSGTDGWYIKNTTTYYQDYQKNYAYIEYFYTFTTYGFKGTAGQAAYNMNFYKVVRAAQCTHDYTVTATKAATCIEKGYTSYLCSKCGDAYTTYTDPLGHDYQVETIAPTEIEQGYDLHTCTRCGDTYTDNYLDPVVIGDPCDGYTDIDRASWYHSAADFVILRKIMGSTQTEALTFEPATPCTRSMIVSILYRLSDSPEVTFEDKFPDVPSGQWFTSAVIWAYQNEIVKGYDTGLFGPNDKITREQMAVILKAYTEKLTSKDTSGSASLADFPDEYKVTWSRDAVRWAVNEGLISGKSNDGQLLLDPQGNATRAEVASILMRFIEGLK